VQKMKTNILHSDYVMTAVKHEILVARGVV
jgi:hypothetical protein